MQAIIYFIEQECYDGHTLQTQGMGGAHSTLVRVAQAMQQHWGARVCVFQKERDSVLIVNGVEYRPHDDLLAAPSPNVIVHQRSTEHICKLAAHWPTARHFYWLHNIFPQHYLEQLAVLRAHGVTTLCVSQFHAQALMDVRWQHGHADMATRIRVVYNPTDALLQPSPKTGEAKWSIAYTSSPNRGLELAVAVVEHLRAHFDARYTLQVFNPGYLRLPALASDAVVVHGSLPCITMYEIVREALAVLVPNQLAPEAFGLVFSEANQVGVPVLTHAHGAALEVLADAQQLMDFHAPDAVAAAAQRLHAWQMGARPELAGRAVFSLPEVLAAWRKSLIEADYQPKPVPFIRSHSADGVVKSEYAWPAPLRCALVTPTYQRAEFLQQAYAYFQAQNLAQARCDWFILDDSPTPNPAPWLRDDPRVHYIWQPEKLPLSDKRNRLNDMALAAGADFICAMDDDDWYGPDYVASMLQQLLISGADFIGSSADYLYDITQNRVLFIPAVNPNSSCNNILGYRSSVLATHRYQSQQGMAEEPGFLRGARVAQHNNPRSIHMALAHPTNTATKRNYIKHLDTAGQLQLTDFEMSAADRAFYEQLHQAFLARKDELTQTWLRPDAPAVLHVQL